MAVKKVMYTGDLKPDYVATLSDRDAEGVVTPVDLDTGVIGIRIIGVLTQPGLDPVVLFDRPATTYLGNEVRMFWEPGDTDLPGLISTEVEVLWFGGKPQTFRPPELVQVRSDFGGVG